MEGRRKGGKGRGGRGREGGEGEEERVRRRKWEGVGERKGRRNGMGERREEGGEMEWEREGRKEESRRKKVRTHTGTAPLLHIMCEGNESMKANESDTTYNIRTH